MLLDKNIGSGSNKTYKMIFNLYCDIKILNLIKIMSLVPQSPKILNKSNKKRQQSN
jgi:hypothetical protein